MWLLLLLPGVTAGTPCTVVSAASIFAQSAFGWQLLVSIALLHLGPPTRVLAQTTKHDTRAVLANTAPKRGDSAQQHPGFLPPSHNMQMTDRTSVPNIWIKGQNVGGCNDGPGVMTLHKEGKLVPLLQAAGAL